MRMWLDVQVGTTTTGAGPVVQLASFSAAERLNQAGTWSALVPATDDRAVDLLQPRRTVLAWSMIDGVKRFLGGGVIDSLRVRLGPDGAPMLEVSGQDLLEEFNRAPVGDVSIEQPGSYDLADYIAAGLPASWSGGTLTGTPPSFVARFVYDTFLGGLSALADKFPIWFRRSTSSGNPRNLDIYLTLPSTVALYAVANADPVAIEENAAMCLITEISEERRANDLVYSAIVFGAGNGDARLTMALATQWPNGGALSGTYAHASGATFEFDGASNAILNTTAPLLTHGILQRALAWKDIAPISNNTADLQAAANTLVAAACQYLVNHRLPVTTYTLSVVGVRQEIKPGDLVRVTARRFVDGETPINIDANLRVLEVRTEMDANGLRTTGLTVAAVDRWPESDNDALVQDIRQSQVMESLPQMGPSVDTISYREPIDDDYSGDLRFWLGDETTTVNQVLVRFRVDPFRSTAKTVGGTLSGTVDIPSHTHTTPNHTHSFRISGGLAPTYPIGFGAAGTAGGLYHNASGSNFDYPTKDGQGGATSASGGGQTGLALDLSSALSLQYGIYEDSAGNTYAASDLEWLVNGSAASETPASTSGGWYELDITPDVVTADGLRPAQAANAVTVRVKTASKTGKRCQVTAQIERRTVIQAIAYS